MLEASPEYLIKGYTNDERIKYGTGAIVPKENVTRKLSVIFGRQQPCVCGYTIRKKQLLAHPRDPSNLAAARELKEHIFKIGLFGSHIANDHVSVSHSF